MRSFKSFLMSGMMLCVLYLIVQSILLVDDGAGTMNKVAQKLYSPFSFATQSDAEDTQVEEPAPAEDENPAEPQHEESAASAQEEPQAEPAPTEEKPADQPEKEQKPSETQEEKPAETEEKKEETPAEAPKPEEGQEEVVGFDTIDLAEPSGNWLAKRIIWDKAQKRYEQIKAEFDKILESRLPFFKRRAEIDRKILEPLYVSAGLDREEITKILTEFTTLLTVDQERRTSLDERQQKMHLAAMEDKKQLEQLQADITKLSTYEDALDSFLDKLMEQTNLGRTYEKQAWQAYKDIGVVLNDKKARELYIGMDTPYKRLTDINQYIQGVFKQDFDKIDATVQEHATRIKDVLQSLREKGLDIRKYSKQLDEKMRQEKEESVQEEAQEGGFMATIASWWHMVTDALSSLYESIMSYFSGSSDAEEPAEKIATPAKPKKSVESKEEKPSDAQPVEAQASNE